MISAIDAPPRVTGTALRTGPDATRASVPSAGSCCKLARAAERLAKNLYGNHYLAKVTMMPFGDLIDVWAVVPAKPSKEVVE